MPTTRPEVEAMNPFRYVRSTGIVDGRWHIVQCWIAKPWAPNPGARRWEWNPVRWWHPGDLLFFARDRYKVWREFGWWGETVDRSSKNLGRTTSPTEGDE